MAFTKRSAASPCDASFAARTARSVAPLGFVVVLLTGQITDRTTGQPIVGVTVRVGARAAKSDSAGRYTLRGIPAGHISLTAVSNDVPPEQFPLVVRAGTNRRDFTVCSTTLDFHCGGDVSPGS